MRPAPAWAHSQRDAEVGDERLALSTQEDVARLDVPVDHAVLVSVVECTRHLLRDRHCIVHTELLLAVDALPE